MLNKDSIKKIKLLRNHLHNRIYTIKEFDITLFDILKSLLLFNYFQPGHARSLKHTLYEIKAFKKIKKIEEDKGYIIVYFHNIDQPLYYPKDASIYSLYLTIMESFYPNAGHYYQIETTKVNSNDIVVDCGAAEGLFSLIVSPICKRVYTIEPLPLFIKSLNLTFAKFNNMEIIPVALSNEEGYANFTVKGTSSALNNYGNGTNVKVDTIDNLFFKKKIPVTYIKADVEGQEIELLEGAVNTIKKYRPRIAITTYHRLNHAEVISKYLREVNPCYRIKVKGMTFMEEENTYVSMMVHAWEG